MHDSACVMYRERWNMDHTIVTVLIRTPKLTRFEPAQYWGGGPPGNSVVLNPCFCQCYHCWTTDLWSVKQQHKVIYSWQIDRSLKNIVGSRFSGSATMVSRVKIKGSTVDFGFDHINRNPPVLIRTPKLTRFEPAQYWGGGPPGNSVVLNPFFSPFLLWHWAFGFPFI
jgi:hypothetical protein